jgi:hypothetical protein
MNTQESFTEKEFQEMIKNGKVVAPMTQEDFVREYNLLCAKMGFCITAIPAFRPRDDGTFSVVIQYSVTSYQRQ